MVEETLVLIKPDAYARGLSGEIIARLERSGLRIAQMRVSHNEPGITSEHYPRDVAWLSVVGGKTLDDHAALGIDVMSKFGTSDPAIIGSSIRERLVDFLASGPLIAMIVTGNRAIETVRKLIGSTLPVAAAPGTIRGDYSSDSTDIAGAEGRPVRNLVHASGDSSEAAREIALWFGEAAFRDVDARGRAM